ncbi:LPS O-antigen chain length determinant protein WzzB [Yokenella regensburgei]|uniref:LPS O-antigen chain length determinant protein WzzB n=1 Tax=Yokenella regensburgei TaxID=158877 RepID=UPI003ED9F591
MTQETNNGSNGFRPEAEQIDLVDLVVQVWRGKMTIAICVVVAVLLAVVYLFVAKEKWTSTAIISQPDAAQIASYNTALNILYPTTSPNINDVQVRVIGRYNAAMSALAESLDNQTIPEKLTVEQAVKGQDLPIKISYVGSSAEAAQKQLTQYIQQVDEQIAKELDTDLKDNIKQQTATLQTSLQTQEKVAQEQKDLRIKQIKEALKYAEQSNVTKPQVQQTQDVNQDTLFLLGSEGLSSMVQNEATRPLLFASSYYQTKRNLIDIQSLEVDPKTIHAYRYVMKPNLPIHRDSPKRSLVLVLAVLLGGLVGAGLVLGRNALRTYQAERR